MIFNFINKAKDILFSNNNSGLDATDVQGAIDELARETPVVRYGVNDPDDSVGKDGDIYIKVTE